jgi:site-specific DNA-methyltransferase (adenine-specific)
MTVDLRLGDYREVLADVGEVDAVITDPPYDERTHAAAAAARRDPASMPDPGKAQSAIPYEPWADSDVARFVDDWSPRCRGWFVAITNHRHAALFEAALESAGRYVFAPLPWVAPGSRVRLVGDGPALWACWIVVARPKSREFATWGSLPGAYIASNRDSVIQGGKPLWLMRSLVRDYSRPGDLVCDPCSGGGTTARACMIEGRRFVGAEKDPATHALAMERIRGLGPSTETQPSLFGGGRA